MRLEYFQMVDRISLLDPEARVVRADSTVPDQSPVFEGHFPGHPLLPGVLMIETMAQTGGWLVLATLRFARMPFLAQVKEAKFRGFVTPGQALEVEARLVQDGSGYAVVTGRSTRRAARWPRPRSATASSPSPTTRCGRRCWTWRAACRCRRPICQGDRPE